MSNLDCRQPLTHIHILFSFDTAWLQALDILSVPEPRKNNEIT